MRILYASERPPYPFFLGGAARCAHELLRTLRERFNADCLAVGSSDYDVTPWSYPAPSDFGVLGVQSVDADPLRVDCGYPVRLLPEFFDRLGALIDELAPDVVWTQLEGSKRALKIARAKGVTGIHFVHDAEFDRAELAAIAALGCHFVCSSEFLAGKVRRTIGQDAHVVYPCPRTDFGVTGDPNGAITMINPHRVKGVQTFIEVARRLPAYPFLLVESWRLTDEALAALDEQLAAAPNVRLMRRVPDAGAVYRETRLLLVPSIWEEGFGMVAIEAQSCRIPVIASERGGLPESVGDGGMLVKDYRDVDAWVAAVRAVLEDRDAYDRYGERAREHAARPEFSVSTSAQRFFDLCSNRARPQRRLAVRLRTLAEGIGGFLRRDSR